MVAGEMKLFSLFNRKVFDIKPGLERIQNALKETGNPHKSYPSVLISGTNGKGSTAAFLESLFRKHGFKTGLFTSPHLIEESERWQINRENMPDLQLEEYIKQLKPVIQKYNLSYFEASALIAFRYFADEKVDIAVLEVGLGGRWDATNVVYPEVSIITNVSLDHTHILGKTTYEIAREKIGIARKDRPLVIGTQQTELISQAVINGIKEIYHYPIGFHYRIKNGSMDYFFKELELKNLKPSLSGKRQFSNCASALTGFLLFCKRNGIEAKMKLITEAVSSTYLPGRMEKISENPLIIVDGAHNEEAIIQTIKELKQLYPDKKLITVFSSMKDKNWKRNLSIVCHPSQKVIVTSIPVSRSIKREDLTDISNVFYAENPNEALKVAKSMSDSRSLILITGSLYLVGEVLKIAGRKNGRNTADR